MRVYFDSGPFLDYLKFRIPHAEFLRSEARRGRDPDQLAHDIEECLENLRGPEHPCFTSSLAFVELESALRRELRERSKRVITSHKQRFFLLSGRSLVEAAFLTCRLHEIEIVPVTARQIEFVLDSREMKDRGLSLADSIHLASAILLDAHVVLTADDELLKLDRVFTIQKGEEVRCLDSDELGELL